MVDQVTADKMRPRNIPTEKTIPREMTHLTPADGRSLGDTDTDTTAVSHSERQTRRTTVDDAVNGFSLAVIPVRNPGRDTSGFHEGRNMESFFFGDRVR